MGGQASSHPVSPWVSASELSGLIGELKEGDALEFWRGAYRHWSVYIGYRRVRGRGWGHWVVHLSSPPDANMSNVVFQSQSFRKRHYGLGGVQLQDVRDVLSDSQVRINNAMDARLTPYARKEIVQRALQALDDYEVEYSVLSNNCEHFVHWIRCGKAISDQVDLGIGTTIGGMALLALGALTLHTPMGSSR